MIQKIEKENWNNYKRKWLIKLKKKIYKIENWKRLNFFKIKFKKNLKKFKLIKLN